MASPLCWPEALRCHSTILLLCKNANKLSCALWLLTLPLATAGQVAVLSAGVGFAIFASATGGGTITPSGAVSVGDGFNQLFTFSGGTVHSVIVDGVTLPPSSFYLFENVTTDHTIQAVFSPSAN